MPLWNGAVKNREFIVLRAWLASTTLVYFHNESWLFLEIVQIQPDLPGLASNHQPIDE